MRRCQEKEAAAAPALVRWPFVNSPACDARSHVFFLRGARPHVLLLSFLLRSLKRPSAYGLFRPAGRLRPNNNQRPNRGICKHSPQHFERAAFRTKEPPSPRGIIYIFRKMEKILNLQCLKFLRSASRG